MDELFINSIANCAVSDTFFSSFKLLQQSEVPQNLWGLNKLPVMRSCHPLLQLDQYILHGVLSLPIYKTKLLWFNHSIFIINTSHVDPWMKPNTWAFLGSPYNKKTEDQIHLNFSIKVVFLEFAKHIYV